jgi:hypothetical protein
LIFTQSNTILVTKCNEMSGGEKDDPWGDQDRGRERERERERELFQERSLNLGTSTPTNN